jgi:hypothetical protein
MSNGTEIETPLRYDIYSLDELSQMSCEIWAYRGSGPAPRYMDNLVSTGNKCALKDLSVTVPQLSIMLTPFMLQPSFTNYVPCMPTNRPSALHCARVQLQTVQAIGWLIAQSYYYSERQS